MAEVEATDELRERLIAELGKHSDEYDVCGCGEWFGLNNWFGHLTEVVLPIVSQAHEDALGRSALVAESDQIPRGRWKDYSPGYAHGYNVGRGHSAAAIRSLAGVTQPASRTIPCSRCDGQKVEPEKR